VRSARGLIKAAVLVAAIAAAGCASSGPSNGAPDPSADRIRNGMMRLGASEARSGCYGSDIARSLKGADRAEAARLIEDAQSKDQMRDGVLSSSRRVKQAFIRAYLRCPSSA